MLRTVLLIAFVLAALPASSLATHPLITDDAEIQGKGKFQLEVNGEISRDKRTADGVEIREDGGKLAAILSGGVSDAVDIVGTFPWEWSRVKEGGTVVSDGNGAGDASLEAKWRFYDKGRVSLAVKPGVTLPVGNEEKGRGTGRVSYTMTFIASRTWERAFVFFNGAYFRHEYGRREDRDANRRDIWHASLAAGAEVAKRLKAVANVGTETNGDRGSDTWPAFLIVGAIYSAGERFDVDIGMKWGLTAPETDLAALAGIAWRF